MIPQDFLDLLRCPLSPSEVRLEQTEDGLVCQRCRLTFPVKDGVPSLRVETAGLPPGCAGIEDLPCQRAPGEARP
jgi:uncharacterized protein